MDVRDELYVRACARRRRSGDVTPILFRLRDGPENTHIPSVSSDKKVQKGKTLKHLRPEG